MVVVVVVVVVVVLVDAVGAAKFALVRFRASSN